MTYSYSPSMSYSCEIEETEGMMVVDIRSLVQRLIAKMMSYEIVDDIERDRIFLDILRTVRFEPPRLVTNPNLSYLEEDCRRAILDALEEETATILPNQMRVEYTQYQLYTCVHNSAVFVRG